MNWLIPLNITKSLNIKGINQNLSGKKVKLRRKCNITDLNLSSFAP